jgi:NADPH:quinone reductase-like Zn-dependent oxidoreductase
MNGVTAIMAIESSAVTAGGTMLVTGGAGALGGYIIQLVRAAGLAVIAHGRSSDKKTMKELGASYTLSGRSLLAGSSNCSHRGWTR